ncbi:MAG: hypothetical protein HY689_09460 [Chloroflexi bacterium]|nr:hypothetical protein [Chloroflexota bacterium]
MRERQRGARPGAWQHGGRAQQTSGRAAQSVGSVAFPQLVYNGRGQPVGAIARDPDGAVWLTKSGLDPTRHKLRVPAGWATDAAHLDALRAAGGAGVRLLLVDGTTLESTLSAWDAHALPVTRGHGEQVELPDRWWTVHRAGARQLVFAL